MGRKVVCNISCAWLSSSPSVITGSWTSGIRSGYERQQRLRVVREGLEREIVVAEEASRRQKSQRSQLVTVELAEAELS